jgi:putative NADH-flavin reductase
MKIVIIGAASRTGAYLLPAAHQLGHELVALTRDRTNLPASTPPVP